jgi:hypothetical protein
MEMFTRPLLRCAPPVVNALFIQAYGDTGFHTHPVQGGDAMVHFACGRVFQQDIKGPEFLRL